MLRYHKAAAAARILADGSALSRRLDLQPHSAAVLFRSRGTRPAHVQVRPHVHATTPHWVRRSGCWAFTWRPRLQACSCRRGPHGSGTDIGKTPRGFGGRERWYPFWYSIQAWRGRPGRVDAAPIALKLVRLQSIHLKHLRASAGATRSASNLRSAPAAAFVGLAPIRTANHTSNRWCDRIRSVDATAVMYGSCRH